MTKTKIIIKIKCSRRSTKKLKKNLIHFNFGICIFQHFFERVKHRLTTYCYYSGFFSNKINCFISSLLVESWFFFLIYEGSKDLLNICKSIIKSERSSFALMINVNAINLIYSLLLIVLLIVSWVGGVLNLWFPINLRSLQNCRPSCLTFSFVSTV